MASLIGNKPNQVPTNGDLGTMAFKDDLGIIGWKGASPTIASASTIQPTAPVSFVSGTTTITTITPPLDMVGGGMLTLIPTGLFSTGTSGNIALATVAIVSKAIIMTYDAGTAKWYPNY